VDQITLIRAIVVVIAAGLWSSFAFILGPRLRQEQQHEFYACLTLAGIAFGVLILHFLSTGWLADAGNATTVQAVAAAAQAAFTVAVIVLTIRTVQANSTMANETKAMALETAKMAKETERMAKAAVDQQQASIRPVLLFRLHPIEKGWGTPTVMYFRIEVFNAGSGPALDTRVFVDGPIKYDVSSSPVQPLAISASDPETTFFSFSFEADTPFADSEHAMRWPRDADDLEAIREKAAAEQDQERRLQGSPAQQRHVAADEALSQRRVQYLKDLLELIAGLRDAGQIRAVYRDLAGASYASSADLVLQLHDWRVMSDRVIQEEDENRYYSGWRPILLGSLDFSYAEWTYE
jgi:hypothetical protein